MADTDDELHTFATRLGLRRAWAQYPGTWKSHYDLTDSKRQRALQLGAIPITYGGAQSIALMQRKRAELGVQTQLDLPL